MAELKDDGGFSGADPFAPNIGPASAVPETASAVDLVNNLVSAMDREQLAEINQLMVGFDTRLAMVNRRLDRVLDRRAA